MLRNAMAASRPAVAESAVPAAKSRAVPRSVPGASAAGFRRKPTVDDVNTDRVLRDAIAAAQRGDHDAIHYLYLRYKDNVFGYVCSIVRDDHDAEDITQMVFTKLMRAIPRYELRGVPFSAWILRIARNLALDHLRAKRPIPVEEVRDPEVGHEPPQPVHSAWRSAFDELLEDQKRVVFLRHVVGLTPPEIAEKMDRSEAAVHGLHHRGRRALQSHLIGMGSAPAGRV
jgi:RNA polymerase sigma-70 factor, ECF subfamily